MCLFESVDRAAVYVHSRCGTTHRDPLAKHVLKHVDWAVFGLKIVSVSVATSRFVDGVFFSDSAYSTLSAALPRSLLRRFALSSSSNDWPEVGTV